METLQGLNTQLKERVASQNLETAECGELAEIIELLRGLPDVAEKLASLVRGLKLAKAKMGGMDSANKLNEILGVIGEFRERLAFVEADIEKLIQLA